MKNNLNNEKSRKQSDLRKYDPRDKDITYKIGAFSVKHKKKIITISFVCALLMFIISLLCSTGAEKVIIATYLWALLSFICGCNSHKKDDIPINPSSFILSRDFFTCFLGVGLTIFSFVIFFFI